MYLLRYFLILHLWYWYISDTIQNAFFIKCFYIFLTHKQIINSSKKLIFYQIMWKLSQEMNFYSFPHNIMSFLIVYFIKYTYLYSNLQIKLWMYKENRINQIYDTEISDETEASYRCKIMIATFFISMRSLSYKDRKRWQSITTGLSDKTLITFHRWFDFVNRNMPMSDQ